MEIIVKREKGCKDFKFKVNGECWECISHKTEEAKKGKLPYTRINVKGKMVALHRLMYEKHYNQKIPEGMVIRHKCDNSLCCNPLHLELGTQFDNMQDKAKRGKARVKVERLFDNKVMGIFTTREIIEQGFANSKGVVSDCINRRRRPSYKEGIHNGYRFTRFVE